MTLSTATHTLVGMNDQLIFSYSFFYPPPGTSVETHHRDVQPFSLSLRSTSTAPLVLSSGCSARTWAAGRGCCGATQTRTPALARTGPSCARWAAARSWAAPRSRSTTATASCSSATRLSAAGSAPSPPPCAARWRACRAPWPTCAGR